MTAGWVAASTRGRSLLRRTIGAAGAGAIASAGSWDDARDRLATTAYGASLSADADRRAARFASSAATIWQLRVLAGWLPPASSGLARTFAGAVEIAAIDRHLARLDHRANPAVAPPPKRIDLGSLATAWPRVEQATTPEQVRQALNRSAWGDPGGSDPTTIRVGLRVAWGRRLLRQAPVSADWVRGGAAVLVARERFLFGRELPDVPARTIDQLLGPRWRSTTSVAALADVLPRSASWTLTDRSPDGTDLWLSEVAVVDQVDRDARRIVDSGRDGRSTVAAVMALLMIDLWRVAAAIESAGRGSVPSEVFDAVA